MSCATNSGLVTRAGRATGLSRLSNQRGYTAGALLSQATRAVDQVGRFAGPAAALALRIVEPTGSQATRKRAAAGRLIQSTAAVGAGLAGMAPLMAKVKMAAKVSEVVTRNAGAAVATLSETGQAGSVETEKRRFLFFKTKQTVDLQRSGLTGWLNGRNVIGQRQVTASTGLTFTFGGRSWHRGTITFEMDGGKRTITQLQSLSYPAENYYFDRRLTNQQTVSLAAGGLNPERLPGFVGRVSKAETLCPAWAGAKRALILARLHWPNV